MLELTKETFEDEVLKAQKTVLVDFYSESCVPCQALMPFIHGLEEKYGSKIKVTSLNILKARRVAISQKVLGVPVIAIYRGGEKVEELVKDDATEKNIEAMVARYL